MLFKVLKIINRLLDGGMIFFEWSEFITFVNRDEGSREVGGRGGTRFTHGWVPHSVCFVLSWNQLGVQCYYLPQYNSSLISFTNRIQLQESLRFLTNYCLISDLDPNVGTILGGRKDVSRKMTNGWINVTDIFALTQYHPAQCNY